MKTLLLPAFLLVFFLDNNYAQVPTTPLVEHFTQASCGPCASANPTMYNTLNTFGSNNYTKITYQTSWPGVDPMNAAYPAGPQSRVNYYNISGVPDAALNGTTNSSAGINSFITSSALNNVAAQMTPYQLSVRQTWNAANSLDVEVKVINVTSAPISSSDRLYLAMVENEISYTSAPGSNGETIFYSVLRQFYDASTGTPTEAPATIGTIPANDSIVYTFNINSLPGSVADITKISFVGFIQNDASKAVEQSAKSQASATIPGALNLSASSASSGSNDYCNYSYTPGINFTNNDPTPITTFTVEYLINGANPVSQTFSGNLAQGQSTTLTFPVITLAGGNSTIEYRFTDVNNGSSAASPAAIAIPADVYSKLNSVAAPAPLVEDMQSAPLVAGSAFSRTLSTGIFDASGISINDFAIMDGPADNRGNIGGFANSTKSVYFAFYNLQSGTMNFVLQPLNLSAGSQMTFSHAYRQYQSENDALTIEVSTDCGLTWNSVWTQSGTTLSTLGPDLDPFYPSVATDWRSNTVDLSAYDNTNDVVIRFRATSAYGNNLFVDDINVSMASNTVAVLDQEMELTIMPNPVNEFMSVEFTLEESNDLNIQIVNTLGQNVQQVATGTYTGTTLLEVNTSALSAGVYFLNINSSKGNLTRRFVVE